MPRPRAPGPRDAPHAGVLLTGALAALCLSLPASAEAKVPRVFFGAEADPGVRAHGGRGLPADALGEARHAAGGLPLEQGGAHGGRSARLELLRPAGGPGRARPREHHGRAGRVTRVRRRVGGVRARDRGRSRRLQPLRARRGEALRPRRPLLAPPQEAPAPAGRRLPDLERAELPAALVRRARPTPPPTAPS